MKDSLKLICPNSECANHHPDPSVQWYDLHGSYNTCGQVHQRYRCKTCGRTFSQRTLSIDFWTHQHLDYARFITPIASGLSMR